MDNTQIKNVYDLCRENQVTLNGLNANVYPYSDGVLITNEELGEDLIFDELYLNYFDFINSLEENNGRF